MRRSVSHGLQWALCGLLLVAGLAWGTPAPRNVLINGKPLASASHQVQGVAYLPVFAVAHALGIKASWNPKTQQVSLDGKAVPDKGRIIDNVVYLPAATLARSAHAALIFEGKTATMRIVRQRLAVAPVKKPTAPAKPAAPQGPAVVSVANLPPLPDPTPTPKAPVPTLIAVPTSTPPPLSMPYQWDVPKDKQGHWAVPGMPSPSPASTTWPAPPPDVGPPPIAVQSPVVTPETMTSAVPYSPRIAANGMFSLTVTNVEAVADVRSAFQPRTGYQFVMVYVSQQNISGQAQVYSGTFSLQDGEGRSYEPQDGLSNFWPMVLRPDGVNFGYLTFEIPQSTSIRRLVLTVPQAPLISVNL